MSSRSIKILSSGPVQDPIFQLQTIKLNCWYLLDFWLEKLKIACLPLQ